MRWRFCSIALIVIGIVVTLGALATWQPKPRLDEEVLERIHAGMTENEVIEIIGFPPGNYGFGEAGINWDYGASALLLEGKHVSWLGPEKGIVVIFGWDHKVNSRFYVDVWRVSDSHFDRLLQSCGWRTGKKRPWNFEFVQ